MATRTPDVLTDPLGVVVDLVAGVEPAMARTRVTEVVTGVAGGRAKSRRLAQALLTNPSVLIDGRSSAPKAAGELLIALGHAGAVAVAAPVCADCGKTLRTLQRRGEHWYCTACGPRAEPCAGCGRTRRVARRDRAGRAVCVGCRPDDDAASMQILRDVIATIDPDIDAATVTDAILAAVRPGHRHRLAWALQDRPELLTGAGAKHPSPRCCG